MRKNCRTDSPFAEAAEHRNASNANGWVLYDADCRFCTRLANQSAETFRRRGFEFLPLQTPWVMERLGLQPSAPLDEMRVLTGKGEDYGGADAVVFLARKIWWAWPLYALAQLPGMHRVINRGYRWMAAHRGCTQLACRVPRRPANLPPA